MREMLFVTVREIENSEFRRERMYVCIEGGCDCVLTFGSIFDAVAVILVVESVPDHHCDVHWTCDTVNIIVCMIFMRDDADRIIRGIQWFNIIACVQNFFKLHFG